MINDPKTIEYYHTAEGKSPFRVWYNSIRDWPIKQIIDTRLDRVSLGNLGDSSALGGGIFELRIHIRSGYRIYFGLVGQKVVLLLWGGIKKSQSRDINKARTYWTEYRRRLE